MLISHLVDSMIYQETSHGDSQQLLTKLKELQESMGEVQVSGRSSLIPRVTLKTTTQGMSQMTSTTNSKKMWL
jgi:hypothetical protein